MTTATQILETLRSWGVSRVFCCPGTTEVPLLDALARPENKSQEPTFVLTTDEAISVSMADGYARASGGLGVAYLHTNVGLANGLAHTYAAQLGRSPIALLTGIKGTATLPHRALTTSARILETAAPYTHHQWQNLREDDLVADIDRALWLASVVPEGPTILTIPQDHISAEPARVAATGPRPHPTLRADEHDLDAAATALAAARRPLIVAGSDVARRHAERALERIAESLRAPVVIESRRDLERWAFRSDHPCFAGLFDPRDAAARDADLIFLAGMPTPLEFSSETPILPAGVPVVHLAEDAGEPGLRVPTRVGLAGDTALVLAELADRVETAVASAPRGDEHLQAAREQHRARVAAWRESVPAAGAGEQFSAATAMRVVAETLGGDGVLVLDGVTSTLPLLRFLERTRDDTLYATSSGSLGWAMGAAGGVALARGERAIAIVGDGVVQFGTAAFWTAARYRIPVTYLVVNNGRYQAVVSGLTRLDGAARAAGDFPLTDISGVDVSALAGAFGIPSTRVTGSAELQEALAAEAGRTPTDGPHLIEVLVNDALWQ